MIKSQQYSQSLELLFECKNNQTHINLSILHNLCQSNDYHQLIDLISIFSKLLSTASNKLSLRQIIGDSLLKNQQSSQINKTDYLIDLLTTAQINQLINQMNNLRKKLLFTLYSFKIQTIVGSLKKIQRFLYVSDNNKNNKKQQIFQDFDLVQEQQQLFGSTFISSISANKLNQSGKITNNSTVQHIFITHVIPFYQKSILAISLNSHSNRQKQITNILNIISFYIVPQYQLQVQISKNTLVQTRIYFNKLIKHRLIKNALKILASLSKIINQAILCPSFIKIQKLLLKILRRFYQLGYQQVTSSQIITQSKGTIQIAQNITSIIKNPLFLVLRNISLFSDDKQQQMKEASMLAYKIYNDKNDLQFSTLIQTSEQLKFLRNSKYFSSKAYIYSDQFQKIYDPLQIPSLYIKTKRIVQPRQLWFINILVERPSSLVCWQFYLLANDIRFGIFKVQSTKILNLQQYQKGLCCKQMFKIQKVQNNINSPFKGHIYLKNGLYRIIFDNTFSMIRSKEIIYSIQQLQSHS